MSFHDDPAVVLYARVIIALVDFAAILYFGYLEVATPATVPGWFVGVLLAIFSATLGVNALSRLGGHGSGGNGGGRGGE